VGREVPGDEAALAKAGDNATDVAGVEGELFGKLV
jgi:hypothetical protein